MVPDQKASINVSIPSEQRTAFFEALSVLKQDDGGLFTSASALIVRAVLDAAQRVRSTSDAEATAQTITGGAASGR